MEKPAGPRFSVLAKHDSQRIMATAIAAPGGINLHGNDIPNDNVLLDLLDVDEDTLA
jgi:hypothetical protein